MILSSFLLTFALSLQMAAAVEWPDISNPIEQPSAQSADYVLVISIEDYELLSPVRNASVTAEAWTNYFAQTQGVPAEQITWLSNADATKGQISAQLKRLSKKVGKQGKLWVVFIGHGITMYDDGTGAILPYETSDTPRDLYNQSIELSELSTLLGKAESKSIVVLDTSFTALDRQGRLLLDTLPEQAGVKPVMGRKATVVSATQPNEYARQLDNNQPALSYVLLGALRGWADVDKDGFVTLIEATDYADMALTNQTPSVTGRLKRQTVAKALEEGPVLARERSMTPVDPMSLVPQNMVKENVSLEQLLTELAQQRRYEVQIQSEIDNQVSDIRESAARDWQKVRAFASQRVDDPARVAVYAFLKEYQNVVIQVQGREFEVDIPEVQLARQLLTRLATPTLEGVAFTWVPAGEFDMGNAGAESQKHSVRLTHSFYASTTEITQQLYQFILSENPSEISSDLMPVTNVSWLDAVRFSNALSAYEGLEECYVIQKEVVTFPRGTACLGYRLPTEAEWEYAARGNKPGGFAGGDRVTKVAWIDSNSGGEVHFVKQKSANAFGLYDMSGNVSEWVWDWYAPYTPVAVSDPLGASSGTYRVQRGGSAVNAAASARVDSRYPVQADYASPSQGFRVVRTVPEM